MSNLHYITDEKLGGIEREYVEVERVADLGDFIHVTKYADCFEATVVKADHIDSFNDLIAYGYPYTPEGDRYDLDEGDEFTALSLTGNVRIDDALYRLVNRKAEVGENILHVYEDKSDGRVLEVTEVGLSAASIEPYEDIDEDGDNVEITGISHGFYRVLVPESKSAGSLHVEVTVDSEVISHLTDLIGNLAKTVAEQRREIAEQQRELDVLKRQLRGNTSILSDRIDANTDDIQTFAEELTEFKAEQADMSEMLTGDIVSLDERTQSEELAKTVLESIAIKSTGGVRYGRR